MSRYLSIARTAIGTNEKDEKSPKARQSEGVTGYEINEKDEISPTRREAEGSPPSRLNDTKEEFPRREGGAEATALGLNPDLLWVHVSRHEVEASAPPMNWDGTLPDVCRWTRLCKTLGPCPQHRNRGACHHEGESS
jgi:hypothetical protein